MGILNEMEEIVKKMYFIDKKTGRLVQKPFQKGLLVSIRSIIELFKELKSDGLQYLLTTRVNQDVLENSFSSLRYMGGNNTHPTGANVCDRLRLLCVSKNTSYVVNKPSVEIQEASQFLTAEILDELAEEFSFTPGSYYMNTYVLINPQTKSQQMFGVSIIISNLSVQYFSS